MNCGRWSEKSVDLAVMNSVAQYMTPAELDAALAVIRRLLKPGGRLVLGDILRPEVGMPRDVLALLRFAATHGFLKDALIGLVSTALSDYRQLRDRASACSATARPRWSPNSPQPDSPPRARMSISATIRGG